MKTWLKIILKIVGGGFGAVFLLLSWNALKDIFFFATRGISCEDIIYIPIKVFLGVVLIPGWDDWAFLFLALGLLFVLWFQLRPLLNVHSIKYGKQLFLVFQIVLLLTTGYGITVEAQNDLAIRRTYSGFCQAVKAENYALAYSYFSPEYQSKAGVNRFIKDIMDSSSFSYLEGCDGEFVGTVSHRFGEASLYPFRWSNSACSFFLGGPEINLVKIAGKWYFTGEHTWYTA
jgi:hypothetical protein